jgi:hypothetical protein
MSNIVARNNNLVAKIESDDFAEGPDKWWDNHDVFLMARHRQFSVDPTGYKYPFEPRKVVQDLKDSHFRFPVEAYIHGGVHLSLAGEGNYPDRRWDVSRVGDVFVRKEDCSDEKKAKDLAKGLLKNWNAYLAGDVWTIIVKNEDTGEVVKSVGGYYGHQEAEKAAKELLAEAVLERDTIPTLKTLSSLTFDRTKKY